MEIHILVDGEQKGPFSETQVRQYLGQGLVASSDLATYNGMPVWESLDHVLAKLPPPAAKINPLDEPQPESLQPDSPPSEEPVEEPVDETVEETAAVSPQIVPSETSASVEPAPMSSLIMPDQPPAPVEPTAAATAPLTQALSPLTATQKTKRKLSKIVIQPILPLEATAPIKKKPATGKTMLTLEPLRPTTSLPPVNGTGPLPREKKNRRMRTGRLSLGALSETPAAKPVATPPVVSRPPEPTPAPVSNGSHPAPPPPLPLPVEKARVTYVQKAGRRPLPTSMIYVGAVLVLVVLGLICYFIYLFAQSDTTPEAKPVATENPATQALIPSVPSPSPAVGPTTAADYSARGFTRQSSGDLDGAIQDYAQAIHLDPKNIQAYYRRGLALQAKGNWNDAIADYNTVLSLDPKNADAFSNRGFVKQATGDADGALADYSQALLLNPKIPVAYYNEGLIEVQKGDLDDAIVAYNHALDLDPKMAIAYYNRGNAKNTEGNLDGAIADYTQALTLNPKIALAYCNRGFARQTKGDSDGALADYAQALALNPKMVVAYYNRGLIKVQKGDLQGAIDDSTHAIDLAPNNGQAYCNRGLARIGQGHLDGAMDDLKKFCELAPKDNGADSARLYLWLISKEQNPKGDADEKLSTDLLNNWNSPPEDLTSKIAAFLLGHISESDLVANAASPDPSREPGQYCKVWYFAGMKRLLAGNTGKAIDYFQKSVATQQKDFCEYIFAQAELQSLGQSLPVASQTPSGL